MLEDESVSVISLTLSRGIALISSACLPLAQKLSQLYIKIIKPREKEGGRDLSLETERSRSQPHPKLRTQDIVDNFMAVGRKFRPVVYG